MTDTPPETVFYAPGVAGKTGPLYFALRGIRSAAKTCSRARYRDMPWSSYSTRVWKGTVTWTEIDIDTGFPILNQPIDLILHLVQGLDEAGHGFESGLPITPGTDLAQFHSQDHTDPRSDLHHTHHQEAS